MNTPKIQFGSSVKKEVVDDKTVKVTETKFHGGRRVTTNKLQIRDRISTADYSVADLVNRFQAVVSDPYKINPSFSVVAGVKGGTYDIIVEYTVLEME